MCVCVCLCVCVCVCVCVQFSCIYNLEGPPIQIYKSTCIEMPTGLILSLT